MTTGVNDGVPVMIDSNGQLGTVSSSERYKEDIQNLSLTNAAELLQKLHPVTFRCKQAFQDGGKPIQNRLIAEEVAAVFPELVVFNQDGQPESVKYHLLTTLLLEQMKSQKDQFAEIERQAATQADRLREKEELIADRTAAETDSGDRGNSSHPANWSSRRRRFLRDVPAWTLRRK